MKKYFIKRTLILIPTFLGAITILFFLYMLIPGNYTDALLFKTPPLSPQSLAQIEHRYYLDRPKYIQFFHWISNALRGNFGVVYSSLKNPAPSPATPIVMQCAKFSLKILLFSMLTSFLISIPIGVKSASAKNKKSTRVLDVITTAGISVPSFVFAIFLFYLLRFNKIVSYYQATYGGMSIKKYEGILIGYVIPIVTLNVLYIPKLAKYLRNSFMNVLGFDYIRTARSQGMSEKKVLYKYALKNALIPVITFLGSSFTSLFSELVVIEATIGGGGLGSLFYSSIMNRQYDIVMAVTFILVIVTLLFNYIIDLCYSLLDPRIRLN